MRHHDGVEADLLTAPETKEAPEAPAPTATPPTPGDLAWTAAITAAKGSVIALAVDAFLNSNAPRYHGKGMRVRAIMRNPDMASACGIDVARVNALTFAYGSGLAGIAGVMIAGLESVFPDMGTPKVVEAFLVVVTGGVGSLGGTVLAAGILGQITGIASALTNDILARAIVFGIVILIIIWKPKGLFSYRGR